MSMSSIRTRRVVAAFAALALLSAGCAAEDGTLDTGGGSSDEGGGGPVTVGSVNFTENIILAEMYSAILEDIGVEVETRQPGASREIIFPAVEQGEIDLVPEYTGALTAFVTEDEVTTTSTEELVQTLSDELEPDIQVLEPAPAQDQDGLVVTPETAEQYNLETVSDLAPVADELIAGGPPEEKTRNVGLPGLKDVYGIEFAEFKSLDAGGPLTIEALESGAIDVGRAFTTQGIIGDKGWVFLEEDKPLIPAENIIPVIRADASTPEIEKALDDLSAKLTTEALTKLNALVDVDKEDPVDVATQFLEDEGLLGN
ncbi:MAG: ABC transporter substrate-binding protein [Actinobacteria bacterium]|nr:ABC transporter substrate-binding protein [Actinomycetota bacterium]